MRPSWSAAGEPPEFRERSQMKDDEIRSRFDGRGSVVLLPGHASAPRQRQIEEIARALGYRLLTTESLGPAGVRLVYERDDGPLARRRTELTIARLRAGGPLLPAVEPPPPPPPGPPPMARRRWPRHRAGPAGPYGLRQGPHRPPRQRRPDHAFLPRRRIRRSHPPPPPAPFGVVPCQEMPRRNRAGGRGRSKPRPLRHGHTFRLCLVVSPQFPDSSDGTRDRRGVTDDARPGRGHAGSAREPYVRGRAPRCRSGRRTVRRFRASADGRGCAPERARP